MKGAEGIIRDLLRKADINVNGQKPWDIQVHNARFYNRVLLHGSLGLGESYMDGYFDVPRLDEFVARLLRHNLQRRIRATPNLVWNYIRATVINLQKRHAFEVGEKHYDIGNDLYRAMLGPSLMYTCGYWKDASNLEQAQVQKLDLVCRKLGLKKGQHILDIGCGWGSFAKYAAEKYGVSVTGITVSKEQVEFGRKLCAGLQVTFELKDYHDIEGEFDHIVSLGMFEHVGYKNHRAFMQIAQAHLKDGGLFLLHTIGGRFSKHIGEPWITKYIFPNGLIPSVAQIGTAIENIFIMEDWHNFGADYDKTLMSWFRNFDTNWPKLKFAYNDRFYRMWKYYLLACAGAFRARELQLWQLVLSKRGVEGGYNTIR